MIVFPRAWITYTTNNRRETGEQVIPCPTVSIRTSLLAIRVEQRGSVDTTEAVKRHLSTLEQNAEFIGGAIAELMAGK